MVDSFEAIMVDIGSYSIKAGFSGEDAPKVLMPTVLGRAKSKGLLVGMDQKDIFVGNEALSKKVALKLVYPVERGAMEEDEESKDMDEVLKHLMNTELKCSFEEQKVMLSEPPNNTMEQRKFVAEKMFESLGVQAVYFAPQPVLSLYASARTTGTVIDCGHCCSYAVPIYEGYYIPHATLTMPLGGRDLSQFMFNILDQRNAFPQSDETIVYDVDVARVIKERDCKVAQDFDAEMKTAKESSHQDRKYLLPSGQEVPIKSHPAEFLQVPELLFSPGTTGRDMEGIHKLTFDAIMKCDCDIRKDLFKNIVLAGGSTLFEGMRERMRKEIQALAPSPMGPEVEAPADRKFSQWLGGSIISNLDSFNHMWITKEQWSEKGEEILYRNCF